MRRKNDDRPGQGNQGEKIANFQRGPRDARSDFGNGQSRQKLPPEVHAFLGYRLRAVYGDLVNEPVPDALRDLLDRLKAQELDAQTGGSAVQDTNEAKEKA